MGFLSDIVGEIANAALNEGINYLTGNEYNITIYTNSFYHLNSWTDLELRNNWLETLILCSVSVLNVKPIVGRTVSLNIDESSRCIDNFVVTNGAVCVYYGMFKGNVGVTISGKNKATVENVFYTVKSVVEKFADSIKVVEDELPPYDKSGWLEKQKSALLQDFHNEVYFSESNDKEDEDGKKFEKLLSKWIDIFQKKDLVESPCFSDSVDDYNEVVSFFGFEGLEDEGSEKPLKSYKLTDGATISCYVGHNNRMVYRQFDLLDDISYKDSVRSEFDTFIFKYTSATGNGNLYFYFFPTTVRYNTTCFLCLGFKNERSQLSSYKTFDIELPIILTLTEKENIDSFCDAAFDEKHCFGGFKGFLRRIGKKDLFRTIIDFVNNLTEIDLRSYSDNELSIVDKVLKYTHVSGECDDSFFRLLDKWDSVFTKLDWKENAKIGKIENRLIIENENSVFVIIIDEENGGVRIIYHPDKKVETTYLEYSDFVYFKSFLLLRFISNDSEIVRKVKLNSFYLRKDRDEKEPESLNTDVLLAILHKYSVFEHYTTFMEAITDKLEEIEQKAQHEQEAREAEEQRRKEEAQRKAEEKRVQEKKKSEDNALSALDNF